MSVLLGHRIVSAHELDVYDYSMKVNKLMIIGLSIEWWLQKYNCPLSSSYKVGELAMESLFDC